MLENLASLFLLDPSVAFLNHGYYGACARLVFEAFQNWQLRLERRDARVAMAGEVGADPDDLVGIVNANTGLNIVA